MDGILPCTAASADDRLAEVCVRAAGSPGPSTVRATRTTSPAAHDTVTSGSPRTVVRGDLRSMVADQDTADRFLGDGRPGRARDERAASAGRAGPRSDHNPPRTSSPQSPPRRCSCRCTCGTCATAYAQSNRRARDARWRRWPWPTSSRCWSSGRSRPPQQPDPVPCYPHRRGLLLLTAQAVPLVIKNRAHAAGLDPETPARGSPLNWAAFGLRRVASRLIR